MCVCVLSVIDNSAGECTVCANDNAGRQRRRRERKMMAKKASNERRCQLWSGRILLYAIKVVNTQEEGKNGQAKNDQKELATLHSHRQ